MRAVQNTDLLIQPRIPLSSYLLLPGFVDRLIASGEAAAKRVIGSDIEFRNRVTAAECT